MNNQLKKVYLTFFASIFLWLEKSVASFRKDYLKLFTSIFSSWSIEKRLSELKSDFRLLKWMNWMLLWLISLHYSKLASTIKYWRRSNFIKLHKTILKYRIKQNFFRTRQDLRPTWELIRINKWNALRNFMPFGQLKKSEKHPCRSVTFSKVAVAYKFTKSNTAPWAFFMFLKLHKWYQIAQHITNTKYYMTNI